jgi:hypothetical protein
MTKRGVTAHWVGIRDDRWDLVADGEILVILSFEPRKGGWNAYSLIVGGHIGAAAFGAGPQALAKALQTAERHAREKVGVDLETPRKELADMIRAGSLQADVDAADEAKRVQELLDNIPGAYEAFQQGLEQAKRGEGIDLDDLNDRGE